MDDNDPRRTAPHPNAPERAQFSARLQQALAAAGLPGAGATALARRFNAHSAQPVTVHAARKWLLGEAIPTQSRLRLLAQLLGVAPDWLRYGDALPADMAFDERALLDEFRALHPAAQAVVRRLMRDLQNFSSTQPGSPA